MNFPENSFPILQQALAGDSRAWDSLFEHLWPIVVSVIAIQLKSFDNNALVDDIAQDIFVHLTKNDATHLRQYQPTRGMLESYVARIARNCTIDFLRRNARHFRTVDISSLPDPAVEETDSPLPMLETWEITAAMKTLTPREREVIGLLFMKNLDMPTAAERMAVTSDTIRSLKSHAIRKLKKFFGQG